MFIKPSQFTGTKRLLWYALVIMILLNLVFIFSQSLLSSEAAGEEADTVTDIIIEVLPEDSAAADYAEDNMDKIAHFTEYAVLGVLVSLFVCFFGKRLEILAPVSLLFAESIAFIDETVQIFSGRNPDVKDMWADIFGFFTLSLITYMAFFLVKRCLKKEKQNG